MGAGGRAPPPGVVALSLLVPMAPSCPAGPDGAAPPRRRGVARRAAGGGGGAVWAALGGRPGGRPAAAAAGRWARGGRLGRGAPMPCALAAAPVRCARRVSAAGEVLRAWLMPACVPLSMGCASLGGTSGRGRSGLACFACRVAPWPPLPLAALLAGLGGAAGAAPASGPRAAGAGHPRGGGGGGGGGGRGGGGVVGIPSAAIASLDDAIRAGQADEAPRVLRRPAGKTAWGQIP